MDGVRQWLHLGDRAHERSLESDVESNDCAYRLVGSHIARIRRVIEFLGSWWPAIAGMNDAADELIHSSPSGQEHQSRPSIFLIRVSEYKINITKNLENLRLESA